MTKDLVIKAREISGTNPIKIICDNMIIIWGNTHGNPTPIVIWDDENERVITLRLNTDSFQDQSPFEILMTEYEHIQFIEVYPEPKNAMNWIEEQKATGAITEEQYAAALELFQLGVGKRSYTGTTRMKNIL